LPPASKIAARVPSGSRVRARGFLLAILLLFNGFFLSRWDAGA